MRYSNNQLTCKKIHGLGATLLGIIVASSVFADKIVTVPLKVDDPVETNKTTGNEVAGDDENKDSKPSEKILKSKGLGNSWTSLNIGAHLLNPYHIVPMYDPDNKNKVLVDSDGQKRHLVESSGSEASISFEFNFINKAAWNPGRRAQFCDDGKWICLDDLGNWKNRLDLQGRIGYYVDGKSDLPSASTIVGSGDFAAELIGGLNLYQSKLGADLSVSDNTQLPETGMNVGGQTFSVQFAYAATTDKSAMDVHHRVLIGPAYTAAIPTRWLVGDQKLTRSILFELRLGPALIETVDFKNGNSREIDVLHQDLPDFDLNLGFGIETEAWLPVSTSGNIVLGARIYGGPDPNMWSAYIAYSIDTDSVFGKLFN